jgi:transposase-like protein
MNYAMELRVALQEQMRLVVSQCIEALLKEEVDRFLERRWYERRRRSKRRKVKERCSRCLSHERQKFRRNGHYQRSLNTQWGRIRINMPQIKCECGGNVRLNNRIIRPRQRMWADFDLEVQVDYDRGLSYRQIKADWDERLGGSVGLRTLNRRVLESDTDGMLPRLWKPGEAPPVVQVDGIWITMMFPTGEFKKDRSGRNRPVKRAKKVPILAALGIWPHTGRTALLTWMRADSEDTDSWQKFLEQLYEVGITPENGLTLLVADGSAGFRSAYENRYWMVPLQRCVFHKLRNISDALRIPAGLNRKEARQFRTQFTRQAALIWQAPDAREARLLYRDFCQEWRSTQSKAVVTLSRNFEDTLTFFDIQKQAAEHGQIWPAHLLRTTSHLERKFREFRRRYRNAVLFHSETGARAVTAHLANRFS